ncbi:hypothetical protein UFOVP1138_47 [uncultured Caudovirales phage]|uniref:Uncharacterized protein n=1 Tax=uncultured Caudovirales phage TaxID=2100421 RepID=A0A6J5PX24_9CAUD|nr:hypothetical protein UFOVP975_74 [uncultured Caudovirales phage]CAB4186263.1 hypothetical protein UFOVP1138_47 [uncultured Caudovirales phage]CAB4204424.1 hypothetical protein UFOVP1394_44 [uncultured Caudovirales phage]
MGMQDWYQNAMNTKLGDVPGKVASIPGQIMGGVASAARNAGNAISNTTVGDVARPIAKMAAGPALGGAAAIGGMINQGLNKMRPQQPQQNTDYGVARGQAEQLVPTARAPRSTTQQIFDANGGQPISGGKITQAQPSL